MRRFLRRPYRQHVGLTLFFNRLQKSHRILSQIFEGRGGNPYGDQLTVPVNQITLHANGSRLRLHVQGRAPAHTDFAAQDMVAGNAQGFFIGEAGQDFKGTIEVDNSTIRIEYDNAQRNFIQKGSEFDR